MGRGGGGRLTAVYISNEHASPETSFLAFASRANGSVKIGVGAMAQVVDIDGFLETNDFNDLGPTQRFPGGYFALPSNIGAHRRTVFAMVPEAELGLGVRITSWATLFVDNSFLYASSVVRTGEQINRNLNTTQSVSWVGEPPADLVGAPEPSFQFHGSSFWAHGVNAGVTFRF